MANIFNSIVDRALPENDNSMLLTKKSNGKYSFFMPFTNLGEIGSAPDQIEKTVVGNMARTYVKGRKDNPQQTMTFFNHRDNLRIAEKAKGNKLDFLRVFPDFSAIQYSGEFDYKINDTTLNSAEQGEASVTISTETIVVDNAYDLIEDTAMFTNDIPEVIVIDQTATGSKVETINVSTNPASATITASSESAAVATATYANNKVTITGVKKGTTIINLKAAATGYNSFDRTIFVIVNSVSA